MGAVVVINNPNAKLNRRCTDRYEQLAKILGDEGTIYQTRRPEETASLAEKVAREDVDILAVCGGDGTLHHTLTAFINAYGGDFPPMLLPLKGGTMNTIYKSVGCRDGAERNLAALLAKRRRGEAFEVARRNIINVSGKYAFLFGNGIGANILMHYYSGPHDGVRQALRTAFDVIAAPVFRTKDYARLYGRLEIEGTVDGKPVPFHNMLAVLAGTVKDIGIGAKPFYRAEETEGKFQAIFIGFGALQAAANAIRIFQGKPFWGRVADELATHATVKAKEPFAYFLDGEVYEAASLELKPGPAIRVIRL